MEEEDPQIYIEYEAEDAKSDWKERAYLALTKYRKTILVSLFILFGLLFVLCLKKNKSPPVSLPNPQQFTRGTQITDPDFKSIFN